MSDLLNIKHRVKQQEKLEEKAQQQLDNDVKEVFGSAAGRRVLQHIFAMTELYNDCFTGNAQTYYYEGKRVIGLELLDIVMSADPEIYIKILRGDL